MRCDMSIEKAWAPFAVYIVNNFVGYVPFLIIPANVGASNAITLLIINYIRT